MTTAIIRDSQRLVQLAYSRQDPQLFIAKWLGQNFNSRDAAVAILALYEVTGLFYRHPETPTPTLEQVATMPAAYREALYLIQQTPQARANLDLIASTFPETQNPDIPGPINTPTADHTWSKANAINRTIFDRKTVGQRPQIRFIPPKRRDA